MLTIAISELQFVSLKCNFLVAQLIYSQSSRCSSHNEIYIMLVFPILSDATEFLQMKGALLTRLAEMKELEMKSRPHCKADIKFHGHKMTEEFHKYSSKMGEVWSTTAYIPNTKVGTHLYWYTPLIRMLFDSKCDLIRGVYSGVHFKEGGLLLCLCEVLRSK